MEETVEPRPQPSEGQWWGVAWAWVGGYSATSTLVIIFNMIIVFSVISNKYLHYSYNYVVVMLSLRNILRCILTLLILTLSKLRESPALLQVSHIIPANLTRMELDTLDLGQADSMPLLCKSVSMLDHFLVIVFMYYTASLFIYLFCRKPNPDVPHTSEMTLRLYGLNTAVIPVREKCWVSPLLLLFPLVLASLLSLPAFLMSEIHPVAVIPGVSLCGAETFTWMSVYESSVVILGFYLPAAIILFLTICLSVRRCCNTCQADTCISSFCKEEMAVSMTAMPHLLAIQLLYLPNLDAFLTKLDLAPTGLQEVLVPELCRGLEMFIGLLLPIMVYCALPAYSKFRQAPDDSDVKNEIHRSSRTPSRRMSFSSQAV